MKQKVLLPVGFMLLLVLLGVSACVLDNISAPAGVGRDNRDRERSPGAALHAPVAGDRLARGRAGTGCGGAPRTCRRAADIRWRRC
jgi:hypothetical protein